MNSTSTHSQSSNHNLWKRRFSEKGKLMKGCFELLYIVVPSSSKPPHGNSIHLHCRESPPDKQDKVWSSHLMALLLQQEANLLGNLLMYDNNYYGEESQLTGQSRRTSIISNLKTYTDKISGPSLITSVPDKSKVSGQNPRELAP